MSDRIIYRRPTTDLLATTGNSDAARGVQFSVYEGLVVDVILDHNHPEYSTSDGYNVGAVKIRIFEVNQTLDERQLPWADPIDYTVYEMPLIGEVVSVLKIRGTYYYSRKIPIAHRVQENGMLKLNELLNQRYANTVSRKITSDEEMAIEKHRFGDYYKPDSRVRTLKYFEGDTLFQGRMGSTIRFGSSKMDPSSKSMAPNIILRTGQGKDLEKEATTDAIFGLILEDINKDASSIWMVSDQAVPFEPSTIKAGSFYRSISNPVNAFDKAQIIANSDRIVLNSKNSHIMLFSNDEVYVNSFSRMSFDTDDSIFLTANLDINQLSSRNVNVVADKDFSVMTGSDISFVALGKLALTAKKIHLGGLQNDVEPIVGGTSLSIFLGRLILALMGKGTPDVALGTQVPPYQTTGAPLPPAAMLMPKVAAPGPATTQHVITPVGPGILSPLVVGALVQLYSELSLPNVGSMKKLPFSGAPFNSSDAFVGMSNEDAVLAVVKNEFKTGSKTTSVNSEWKLTDPYYKVV